LLFLLAPRHQSLIAVVAHGPVVRLRASLAGTGRTGTTQRVRAAAAVLGDGTATDRAILPTILCAFPRNSV
jgi:hypothetical protein